jgi:selenocysteine lyase/cysteine desulfurase
MHTSTSFRQLFPALDRWVWFDTPGSPPAARPVTAAVQTALDSWASGDFDWIDWDSAVDSARELFRIFLGAEAGTITALGSVAEAAATVSRSLPPGRIVVAEQEFRSALMPWSPRHEVVTVPEREGVTHTEDLVAAIDDGCSMVAVSDVTTRAGARLDLVALRAATDRVGARLFVDVTQSLGVLRHDVSAVGADYVAVHGYKWLLCPRGAAWLATRPDRVIGLEPLAPNWHSLPAPRGYFGQPESFPPDASRCDASPAWLAWIGATAALGLHLDLDQTAVEARCRRLADELSAGLSELGLRVLAPGSSHIVVALVDDPDRARRALRDRCVRAGVSGDRVRFGVHYFNNEQDVLACVDALYESTRRK